MLDTGRQRGSLQFKNEDGASAVKDRKTMAGPLLRRNAYSARHWAGRVPAGTSANFRPMSLVRNRCRPSATVYTTTSEFGGGSGLTSSPTYHGEFCTGLVGSFKYSTTPAR